MDDLKRSLKNAKKIRKQLGGSENIFEPFPKKPVTMHYQRYTRLKFEDRALKQELLRGEK